MSKESQQLQEKKAGDEWEKEKLVCVLISGELINILENDGNS